MRYKYILVMNFNEILHTDVLAKRKNCRDD